MKKKNEINKAVETTVEETVETAAEETVGAEATEKKPSRFNWKTNRKLRLGTTATVFTAVVIAAVMIFNVIVGVLYDRFPWKIDLTTDNTYTMSDQGRAVAKNVKKDVEILVFLGEKYFSAPNLSDTSLNTVLRQFYLFTKEYSSLSGGKLTTTYLDMDADPTLSATYADYNVEYGSILFRCGEQYRVISVDDLYSYDYSTTYGTYSYFSKVDEVLSSTVNSICGGKTVTITFLTGHGEDTALIEDMSSLYQLNGYTTETLNFNTASAAEIDETTEMLVIAAPKTSYSLDEISRLREWLHNDGNLDRNLFVLCNYECEADPETNRVNLYDFLADDYGITVTKNLIVETDSSSYMPITGGEYQPLTMMNATDLTGSNGTVVMPYTLQLELSNEEDPAATGVGNVALVEFPESAQLVEVESLQEGKTKVQKEAENYPLVGMAYAVEASGTVSNHVIVSGSYQFPGYRAFPSYDNEELMLEPIRETCSLGDTLSMSAKDLTVVTLGFTEANARVINIFFIAVPVLLILTSLVIFFRRRHL